jgi:PIN domain nuclease of toxin-antitoxin system
LSSKKKKIKIELEDDEGGKYNLSLEGNFSKEKILQVIELMELVRSDSTGAIINNSPHENNRTLSVDSKIWNIIEQSFYYSTFTSSDIVNIYNKKYNETIKLSIISTYLARYVTKGKLNRTKRLREYVYDLVRTSSTNADSINTNIVSSNPDNDNKIVYDVGRKTIDDLKN